MNHYKNKLAFVTGASEGIGKEVVRELVKAGAHVVFTSRSNDKLEQTYQEILPYQQDKAQTLAYVAFDVTDAASTKTHLEKMVVDYGVPHFVMNCAGYAQAGFIEELKISDFEGMMRLNYMGIVNVCHAIVPHLQKARRGVIVNTSSMAGFVAMFGYTGYSASKFAVIGFTEALKRELKPYGISVKVLCPPNTKTPGLDRENLTKPKEVLATEEKATVVTAEFVAKKLLKALPKRSFWIIPTFDGKLAHWLQRHFPWIIELFVKRKSY